MNYELSSLDMSWLTIVMFAAGLSLLVLGGEWLVRGASKLAVAIGISPLVVGLTVVAFGTSAPELAVSVQASIGGQGDLAIGNIIGSNISNILLILGLSALVAPLVVSRQLVRLDVPLMIIVSVVAFVMSLDGRISTFDGWVLFGGLIVYTAYAILSSRRETRRAREESGDLGTPHEENSPRKLFVDVLLILAGIGLLTLGSRWLVISAVEIARFFGVSELVIGLSIVAIGTSLPELATSVVAALKGERDIAVGNVVGSNLFNILSVLGLTAVVVPLGVAVPAAAIAFDFPFMIAVSLACLPIFFTGYRIERWEGALFLFYYAAYLTYLVMDAATHDALPYFSRVMLWFVVPLTVITILAITMQTLKKRWAEKRG
jgi:cation:H+ antiporter